MRTIPNTHDGTQAPPRLKLYGNDWGLSQLPRWPQTAPEWTYAETLERARAAGFTGMQAAAANAPAVRALGLGYCLASRANTPDEIHAEAARARALAAESLVLHVGWGWEDDAEVDQLCHAVFAATERHGVPVYIETHRATIAQDVWRTCQMIARHPGLRFNGDFSHYYCGQELPYAGFARALAMLQPVLARCATFHGRISNGSCMQVGVGDGRTDPHAQNFKTLWREAMTYWLRTARPGDVLIFIPELGPPATDYAIKYTDAAGVVHEVSDRWEQTLVIKRLAEEAFAEAQAAAGL